MLRARHATFFLLVSFSLFVTVSSLTMPHALANEDDAKSVVKKEIHVFIESQTLIALENNKEVYSFDVVTGQSGKETTVGNYSVMRKHKKYSSKTYGSEMP